MADEKPCPGSKIRSQGKGKGKGTGKGKGPIGQPKPRTTTTTKIPCEVYSRVVGYLRPIQNWNTGKQQEFEDRKVFRVPPD